MPTYLFIGVVYPERAQISMKLSLQLKHFVSGKEVRARISIVLNQIVLWVESELEWDIFDLRNVARTILQNELAIVGYLKGYAYEVEVRRVVNPESTIDYVFGIDIPCIANRYTEVDLPTEMSRIRDMANGDEGVFLHRCFADIVSAMKNVDDTGFYCYRAVESLRQHCLFKHQMSPENKAAQWKKLRELAGCSEATLKEIKAAADSIRHGGLAKLTSDDRAVLLGQTWDVVDGYLKGIQSLAVRTI